MGSASANGNILFLVCKPCEEANEKDFGIKIAGRTRISWYEQMAPTKVLNTWFGKHRNCAGRGFPDHFVLGYLEAQNADQDPIKAAVNHAIQ